MRAARHATGALATLTDDTRQPVGPSAYNTEALGRPAMCHFDYLHDNACLPETLT